MNNKGFTLIELLAVILILSLLALLANTSVTKVVRDSKTELYNSQLKMIEIAAESWGGENIDKLPDSGECKYLTLGDLKSYGLLNQSVKNPKTDKEFSNDLNIKITGEENKYGKINITYEVDPDNVEECEKALVAETLNTLCNLNSGYTANTIGAKYTCDFGAGARNFYILELGTNKVSNSTLESDEVALILEGNYDTTTQYWCDQNGANPSNNVCAADGLTAKLDEIAGVWTKLEREQIGLPSGEQLSIADGQQTEDAYTGWITLSNSWLYNWPDNADYGNNAPYGYWTSSPYVGNSDFAWYVDFGGDVDYGNVDFGDGDGVRPVVTLKL